MSILIKFCWFFPRYVWNPKSLHFYVEREETRYVNNEWKAPSQLEKMKSKYKQISKCWWMNKNFTFENISTIPRHFFLPSSFIRRRRRKINVEQKVHEEMKTELLITCWYITFIVISARFSSNTRASPSLIVSFSSHFIH